MAVLRCVADGRDPVVSLARPPGRQRAAATVDPRLGARTAQLRHRAKRSLGHSHGVVVGEAARDTAREAAVARGRAGARREYATGQRAGDSEARRDRVLPDRHWWRRAARLVDHEAAELRSVEEVSRAVLCLRRALGADRDGFLWR